MSYMLSVWGFFQHKQVWLIVFFKNKFNHFCDFCANSYENIFIDDLFFRIKY